jgi:hypothetical protein
MTLPHAMRTRSVSARHAQEALPLLQPATLALVVSRLSSPSTIVRFAATCKAARAACVQRLCFLTVRFDPFDARQRAWVTAHLETMQHIEVDCPGSHPRVDSADDLTNFGSLLYGIADNEHEFLKQLSKFFHTNVRYAVRFLRLIRKLNIQNEHPRIIQCVNRLLSKNFGFDTIDMQPSHPQSQSRNHDISMVSGAVINHGVDEDHGFQVDIWVRFTQLDDDATALWAYPSVYVKETSSTGYDQYFTREDYDTFADINEGSVVPDFQTELYRHYAMSRYWTRVARTFFKVLDDHGYVPGAEQDQGEDVAG